MQPDQTAQASRIQRWDVSGDEYHADRSLSQSKIKNFLDDPAQFKAEHIDGDAQPREATPQQQFGIDLERLLLYGESPGIMIPNNVLATHQRDGKTIYSRRGADWEAWKAEQIERHGENVQMLREEEFSKTVGPLLIARDRLREHSRAKRLIYGDGEPHVGFRWTDPDTGLPCKCQLDMLHGPSGDPRIIVDLKAMRSIKPSIFNKDVLSWGYHIQSWWYSEAVRLWCGEQLPFVFVVVKNKPSFSCETFDLDEDWFKLGREKAKRAMERIAKALETGDWTTETHGRVVTLSPPKYAFYDD